MPFKGISWKIKDFCDQHFCRQHVCRKHVCHHDLNLRCYNWGSCIPADDKGRAKWASYNWR